MPSKIPGMTKHANVTLKRGFIEADEFDFAICAAEPEAATDVSAAAIPFVGMIVDAFEFTPPGNPATPPGVPIPYPNFELVVESVDATAADFVTLA